MSKFGLQTPPRSPEKRHVESAYVSNAIIFHLFQALASLLQITDGSMDDLEFINISHKFEQDDPQVANESLDNNSLDVHLTDDNDKEERTEGD